jgi:phosphoribosylaminoimidazolecarboxamide formyltransferase/IMP cyclohydrolase
MGPFTDGGAVLQGKQLSYNNVLDATAAANLAAGLRGPACVIVKHTNPCGAAERPTLLESWQSALAADPVSAFGGVVGLTGIVDRDTAQAMTAVFLEVVVAPGYDEEARAILATKENLRLLVDERLDGSRGRDRPTPGRTASIRTTGGAVLVGAPDSLPDDPTTWRTVSILPPTDLQQHDLELAWQLARGVVSNAIVLVRDGMLIGIGSGQTSRVDAARQAVEKARTMLGPEVLVGAACASDAFFPFPDAVAACLAAGVGAFVQPGGSLRDADAIAAVNAAGATMVVTGTRHFRH